MAGLNRHPITRGEFDSIIAPYKERMIVQRIGVHYGSMLYFKMGKERSSLDRERLHLTLQADWWTLLKDGAEVCNSTSINREVAETVLIRLMRGACFLDLIIGSTVILSFSHGFSVVIRPEQSAQDDYDLLFSLYLPEKTCIVLTDDALPQLAIAYESMTSGDGGPKGQVQH